MSTVMKFSQNIQQACFVLVVWLTSLALATSINNLAGGGGSGAPSSNTGTSSGSTTLYRFRRGCRCAPNQWQGQLLNTEREVDLTHGQTGSAVSSMNVYYDYTNRRFATVELGSGNRAVADYTKGFLYNVRGNRCRRVTTDQPMRRMCVPDDATMTGPFLLASDVPIQIWQFVGASNATTRIVVNHRTCAPIFEEIYVEDVSGLVSSSTAMYVDITSGIKDPSVFDVPSSCHDVIPAETDVIG